MGRAGRLLRAVVLGLGSLVLLLAVVAAAALIWLRTPAGERQLAALIESQLSEPGIREIHVGSLGGTLPQRIELRGLKVRDAEGIWLSLDSAVLVWQPLDLVHGLFHVKQADFAGFRLDRLPPGKEPAAEGGLPSAPPVAIRIDSFRLADAQLGEAVLGMAARFRAEGGVRATADNDLRIRFVAERTDETAGRAALDARLENNALSVTADYAEPKGGLAARLLDIPGLPALSLTLRGEGPVKNWPGRLSAGAEGLAGFEADFRVVDGDRLVADGRALLRTAMPDRIRRTVGNEVGFEIDARLAEDGAIVAETVGLTTAAGWIAAEGRVAPEDDSVDATIRLLSEDAAPLGALAGIGLGRLEIEARVRGALSAPQATVALAARDLAAGGVTAETIRTTLRLDAKRPLSDPAARIGIAMDGSAQGLSGLPADLEGLFDKGMNWQGAASVDPGAGAVEDVGLTVETGAARAVVSGRADLAPVAAEGMVELSVADLSALPGLPLAGRGTATLHIDRYEAAGPLTARLEAALHDLNLAGGGPAGALLGREVRLTAALDGDLPRLLRLEKLTVEGAAVRLEASAALTEALSRLDARYSASVQDLAAVAAALGTDLAGGLTLTGTASGALADPTVDAKVTLSEGGIAGIAVSRAEAQLRATNIATAPQGRLSFDARTGYGPAGAATQFTLERPGVLALRDLTARLADAELRSDRLAVDLARKTVAGGVAGDLSLAAFSGLAGMPLAGQASLALDLREREGRQGADLTVRGRNIDIGTVALGQVALSGQGRDLFDKPGFELALEGKAARLADLRVQTFQATASGDPASARFAMRANGKRAEKAFQIAAAGTGGVADGVQKLVLEDLTASLAGRTLALDGPARLSRGPHGLTVDGLALVLGDGRLTLDGRLASDRIRLALDATDIPLAMADLFAETAPRAGTLRAQIRIDGTPARPTGRFDAGVSGLRFDDAPAAGAPALAAEAHGTWQDGRLSAEALATGWSKTPARLTASLPLRLDRHSFRPVVPEQGRLEATAQWRGEIARLWQLVPVVGHQLAGQADLSVRVGGTVAAPDVDLQATVADGSYENLALGTVLRDMRLTATGKGAGPVRFALLATDGGDGRLEATGAVRLGGDGPALDVTATARHATLVRRDDATATLDADIRMTEDAISGTVKTEAVEVRLRAAMPPSVVRLDVVEVGGSPAQRREAKARQEAEKKKKNAAEALALDLVVEAPQRVFVRGRGLEAEWAGKLTVAGTTAEPQLNGELHIVRGDFRLAGKTFEFKQGRIDFGGAPETAQLDIVAAHSADEITARIIISGTVAQPEIRLESVPPLPQDEIFAQVLFGKSTGQLGAAEALQVAQAVATLIGKGPGLLDRLRSTLGVDVLRVDPGASGEEGPSITAGRYIGENVFVGAKQGARPGSGKVTVEIEVTPNVTVETDAGQDIGANVGVNWKWDY